jgi:hypothetical protein
MSRKVSEFSEPGGFSHECARISTNLFGRFSALQSFVLIRAHSWLIFFRPAETQRLKIAYNNSQATGQRRAAVVKIRSSRIGHNFGR